MDGTVLPLLWAQAAGATAGNPAGPGQAGAGTNPVALASLALRRWFSGQTLSSPQVVPDSHAIWAFVFGLIALLVLAVCLQGVVQVLRQVVDLKAHVGLVRRATIRVWKAGRLVAAAITFTVLSWTGSQSLTFLAEKPEKGRADLTTLTRSRGSFELAMDQGVLAALTPLRDLTALADNLPLLLCAVYLVFRASSGTLARIDPVAALAGDGSTASVGQFRRRATSGWSTMVWGCGSLYALYRLVARFAGSADLPLGGCLVIEALVIPAMMAICDGFLLALVLAELRDASFDGVRDDRFHPAFGLELMPAASLACVLALPARYVATLVLLGSQHLPTDMIATPLGQYVRWQLGWGLIDLQAASVVLLGLTGVAAWSRGSSGEVVSGFWRLVRSQGGYLVVAIALSGVATCILASLIYPLILLLPPAGWILPAADSYSHYLTLPAGLWTVAALIELAQRSLPVAHLASSREAGQSADDPSGSSVESEQAEVILSGPSPAARG